MRDNDITYHKEVKKKMMYENNERHEIIEFCLKHDLIKKTEYGYIIKRGFFEILDVYNAEG